MMYSMDAFLAAFVLSLFAGIGTAVILVEKGVEWPLRRYVVCLRRFLQKRIHRKAHRVLKCAVCASFWTTLISDFWLYSATGGAYFYWPFSGFAAAFVCWTIYQTLAAIEAR